VANSTDGILRSGEVYGLTDEQIANARKVVASHSKDVDDCALLCDVLGLLPAPPEPDPEQVRRERKEEREELRRVATAARQVAWARQIRECRPT
jgi:hypothetical protein